MPKKIDYIIAPCPFCGSAKAPTVTTVQESEQCVHFESASCKCFELDEECEVAHVICDITKGGCGASSGYCLSKGEAVSKWNARPEPPEQKAEKKHTVSVGTITAKWMPIAGADVAQCSNCGQIAPPMYKDYNFCPYCGAYITGEAKRKAGMKV